jgi:hypothetical protein
MTTLIPTKNSNMNNDVNFDATTFINSVCNNDSNCKWYYNNIIQQSVQTKNYYSDNSGRKSDDDVKRNSDDDDMKRKSDDDVDDVEEDDVKRKSDDEEKSKKCDKCLGKPDCNCDDKFISNLQNVPTWAVNKNQSESDYYSYYGALSSKGGDFIPVNDDFSSFRK